MALALGCSSEPRSGLGEPFRVRYLDATGVARSAQFFPGELPVQAPTSDATPPPSSADGGAGSADAARITQLSLNSRIFYQGEGDRQVTGRASLGAYTVGLKLGQVGSGYWVLPVGPMDVTTNEYTWEAYCDFATSIPSAFHDLIAVAFDEKGEPSTSQKQELCIASRVPDAFNACDHKRSTQAVISLTWDANVDLDLQVLTPDGVLVDPKHPSTALDESGAVPSDAGLLDRDSNASCRIDGIRAENLVWTSTMPQGRYGIYANLASACNQPAVRFRVEVYSAVALPDGGDQHLQRYYAQGGEILAVSANGGAGRGLFVTEFIFH